MSRLRGLATDFNPEFQLSVNSFNKRLALKAAVEERCE